MPGRNKTGIKRGNRIMDQSDQKKHIRELARQIKEFSDTPENEARIKRWRNVNALRKPDRMPVYTFPSGDGVWREIIPEESVLCDKGCYRDIEIALRMRLYKMYVEDDEPQPPFYPVHAVYDAIPANTWGVDVSVRESGKEGGSWGFNPAIRGPEDFSKLLAPRYTYNEAKTEEKIGEINDLIGDILPAKFTNNSLLSADVGYHAALLLGFENLLVNILAEPEFLHSVMDYLTKAIISGIDGMESTGKVTPNTDGDLTYIQYSDPIGRADDGCYSMKNCWCIASSQEFDPVSPEKWEEFSLDYQKKIFERYGLVSYGCCENLTNKADAVMTIPNLRVFVCSPWTDLKKLIGKIGDRYVIQWRQKASDVIFCRDPEEIKKHLHEGAEILKGIPAHITLREVETLNGNPDLQKQWVVLAKEAAAKI